MSADKPAGVRDLPEPVHVCRFCGFEIEKDGQQCLAKDDGVCRP